MSLLAVGDPPLSCLDLGLPLPDGSRLQFLRRPVVEAWMRRGRFGELQGVRDPHTLARLRERTSEGRAKVAGHFRGDGAVILIFRVGAFADLE